MTEKAELTLEDLNDLCSPDSLVVKVGAYQIHVTPPSTFEVPVYKEAYKVFYDKAERLGENSRAATWRARYAQTAKEMGALAARMESFKTVCERFRECMTIELAPQAALCLKFDHLTLSIETAASDRHFWMVDGLRETYPTADRGQCATLWAAVNKGVERMLEVLERTKQEALGVQAVTQGFAEGDKNPLTYFERTANDAVQLATRNCALALGFSVSVNGGTVQMLRLSGLNGNTALSYLIGVGTPWAAFMDTVRLVKSKGHPWYHELGDKILANCESVHVKYPEAKPALW